MSGTRHQPVISDGGKEERAAKKVRRWRVKDEQMKGVRFSGEIVRWDIFE